MVEFRGFRTKDEAKEFQKEHGGYLTWEETTPKRGRLTKRGEDYMMAVAFGGLDKLQYPYCVQWNRR